jgi:hypothetical protein
MTSMSLNKTPTKNNPVPTYPAGDLPISTIKMPPIKANIDAVNSNIFIFPTFKRYKNEMNIIKDINEMTVVSNIIHSLKTKKYMFIKILPYFSKLSFI